MYLAIDILKCEKNLLLLAYKFKSSMFVNYLNTLVDLRKKYVKFNKEAQEEEKKDEEQVKEKPGKIEKL
jgi:hypothetical protein